MTRPVPGALWARIRGTLFARGAAPAVTFLDARLTPTPLTAATLLARVDELAERLRASRIEAEGPLGILASSQETQVVHFLAALAAGLKPALLTPPNRKLHPAHYRDMFEGVTRRCRFAAIIGDVEAPAAEATLLEPWTLRPIQVRSGPPAAPVGDASFLQFSSGTTGIKRGVLVSDAAALAQVDAYASAIGLSAEDTIVSWLPLYHDMGFMACMILPLARGTHTVMIHPLDWVARPSLYLHAVTRWRGTLSWHPNFAFAFMADRVPAAECAGIDLSSLRALVNCSEPVTDEAQSRFLVRYAPHGLRPDVFCGCYAMAETTYALTHGRCTDPGYRDSVGPAGVAGGSGRPALSVGRALPGVCVEIVSEDGTVLPDREVGEVRVRSRFNLEGYYNNPEATRAAIRDGWYHTGDLGYRVGAELFVSGRKKELLIVGGVNVWPQDLEGLACAVPGVRAGRATAFAEFDAERQTERVVLLAETEVPPAEHRAIAIAIRQRVLAALQIANFEVHVVPPGWLTKSSSGKLARRRNQERWAEQALAA